MMGDFMAGLRSAGVIKPKKGPTPSNKPRDAKRAEKKRRRQARKRGRRNG